MDNITIDTHHNVQANYQMAGVMDRIWAVLIDTLILTALSIIVNLLLLSTNMPQSMVVPYFLFLIIPSWLYWLLTEWLMNGQTLGKRALSIKVVKVDGTAPAFTEYFLRFLLVPIDYGLQGSVALLSIIFTRNNQRLGDLLAGTTVVKAQAKTAQNIRESFMYQKLEPDYAPTYTQARSLSSEDLKLIKRALQAYEQNYHIAPLQKLQLKLCERLQIERKTSPRKFLITMVKDHSYYQQQHM